MYQFFSVTLRNYKSVGTVWPSSRALSKALALNVTGSTGPKRVLEVGPGTGPVTKYILDSLRPGDQFDLVELNPEFCAALRSKVLKPWQARHPNIAVALHECAVEKAPLRSASYDHIVSGLPFNNFPATLVRQIMDRFMELLKPNGTLSYFGYAGMRPFKSAVFGAEQ
ncbi:MAG: methyltransferase domain-containing protein, partial [Phycisphaerae bacterium]|nr:methyltransferase domain-containing protein [Phycisphaerae bacterium]